jgi:hypothetical protein
MANEGFQPPVGIEDLDQIKERLKDLDLADVEIAKAERAGIPMAEQRQKSQDMRRQLLQIKQTYFPGK